MERTWRWPLRRPSVASSANDLSGVTELDLIEVTLLRATPGAAVEIPHLGLGFAERGVTVRRRDGTMVALIPWAAIVRLSIERLGHRPHQLSTNVRLELESTRGLHRFVVPNVQPEALRGSLKALSGRYGRDEHVLAASSRR